MDITRLRRRLESLTISASSNGTVLAKSARSSTRMLRRSSSSTRICSSPGAVCPSARIKVRTCSNSTHNGPHNGTSSIKGSSRPSTRSTPTRDNTHSSTHIITCTAISGIAITVAFMLRRLRTMRSHSTQRYCAAFHPLAIRQPLVPKP